MASNRLIASVSALTLAAVVAGKNMAAADPTLTAEDAPAGECMAPDWTEETDNPYLERVQDFLNAYDDPSLTVSGAGQSAEISPGAYLLGVLEDARTADGQEFRICIGEAETEGVDFLPEKLEASGVFTQQTYYGYERGELVGQLIHQSAVNMSRFIHEHLYEDPSGPFDVNPDTGVLTISPEFFDAEDVTDKTSDAFLRAGMALTYELQELDFATRGVRQFDLSNTPNFYTNYNVPASHAAQSVASDMFSKAVSGEDIENYDTYFYTRNGTGEFYEAILPSSGAPLHALSEALEDMAPYEAGLFGRCATGYSDRSDTLQEYGSILGLNTSFAPSLARSRVTIDRDRNFSSLEPRNQDYMRGILTYVAQRNSELSNDVKEEARAVLLEVVESIGTANDVAQIRDLPANNVIPALVQIYTQNIANSHVNRLVDSEYRYLAGNACQTFESDYPGQPTLAQ